jgi:PTS system nitrogen regulatory IIA component
MQLLDILAPQRVAVVAPNGASNGAPVRNKSEALRRLAELLSAGQNTVDVAAVEEGLTKREEIQSTGVGAGVAIPHAKLDSLDHIIGAVLLCPKPIGFDAIDGEPVSILFAVLGPVKAPGEHIKTLARVSRLLRDDAFRARLVTAPSGQAAFDLIAEEERRPQP